MFTRRKDGGGQIVVSMIILNSDAKPIKISEQLMIYNYTERRLLCV